MVQVGLRTATVHDAQELSGIYNQYISETVITFEEEPLSAAIMAQRISDVTARLPWLVATLGDSVVGYAYATGWRQRAAYRNSVETTIYLARAATGQGIGLQLYAALLAELQQLGLHCAVAGIALPNPASIALHERLGFQQVAHFREIGWKHDRWVDVGYWQLQL